MHVRPQEIGAADQVVEVELAQLRQREELEVVVDFAGGAAAVEGVGVVGVLGHFFDNVVQEGAPFGRGAQLRDEEGVLLAAFVGREEHAAVFAPLDVVEVVGGLDARPGVAVSGVPDFDDALVSCEDLGLGCLGPGRGSGVEVDDVFDWSG